MPIVVMLSVVAPLQLTSRSLHFSFFVPSKNPISGAKKKKNYFLRNQIIAKFILRYFQRNNQNFFASSFEQGYSKLERLPPPDIFRLVRALEQGLSERLGLYLQIGPIRQSVCSLQAFPFQCNVLFQLIGPIHNFTNTMKCCECGPKSHIYIHSFLHNLRIGPISYCGCFLQTLTVQCNVIFQLIEPIHNFTNTMKYCEQGPNSHIYIHSFLHNLRIGPISQSGFSLQAFPVQCNVLFQLIGHNHNVTNIIECPKSHIHIHSFSS